VTRTGFDMDPFVVVSLGKKTYRTRVIRHNLNPVFDEKMIFQVLRQEQNYSMSFSVVDRDKLSGNDFVAQCSLALQDIISTAPEADPETGLYRLPEPQDPNLSPQSSRSRFKLPLSRSSSASSLTKLARPGLQSRSTATSQSYTGPQTEPALLMPPSGVPDPSSLTPIAPVKATDDNQSPIQEGDNDLKSFTIPLILKNKDRWEDKHSPELIIRAKYLPYPALRQQFWRALLKQYDADDSGRISKVELSTMLDTLGSTLKESTIDGFFKRYAGENEDISCMELSFDQAVTCLEDQLDQSSQKRSLGESIKAHIPDVPGLPTVLHGGDSGAKDLSLAPEELPSGAPKGNLSEPSVAPTVSQDTLGSAGEEGDLLSKDDLVDEKGVEHVIEITECPICHQPRLNKRSETDIITHIATCASQDWRQVNNIVMAGFVTSSQAQRKWYSKVITKISYGGYKLGANSANILVQDRMTGQINEERMSVYVRLGIRLLYKGLKSREMEKKRS
jgi:phosphatidylserine decarboxylase